MWGEIQQAQLLHWSSTARSERCHSPDAWQLEKWGIQDLRQDTLGAAGRIFGAADMS